MKISTPTLWHKKYTAYDKKKVMEILMWLNDDNAKTAHERTKVSLSKGSGVSPSLVTQILAGAYPAPPIKYIKKMLDCIKHWNVDPAQPNALIPTTVYSLVHYACKKARESRSFSVIAGAVGVGKTCCLKDYAQKNSGCIYLRGMSTMNQTSLIDDLLVELGLKESGSTYQKLKAVTNGLLHSNRLIILDEADMVPGKTLETLRTIRDIAEVGILLAGTQALRASIGQEFGQFDQIRSRVAFWPQIIKCLSTEDIYAISESHLHDITIEPTESFSDIVECLKDISKGSARVLIEDLFPNIKTALQKHTDWKLSTGLIKMIAKQFLGFAA